MKQLLKYRHLGYVVLTLLADLIFFSRTNPANVPSFVLIIGFLIVLATVYFVIKLAVVGACYYLPTLRRTRHRLALFITGIFGALLALQSLGQLSTRDVIVIVPIAIVVYIYATYARSKFRPQV